MRAVICALNSKFVHSSLAAWYLLAGVETYGAGGVTAEVLEGTVNEDFHAVAARIIDKKPDAIGFGCYIWNIGFVKKLLPAIKKALPGAAVILGGPEVSYNAGEVLNSAPLVDFIISGEGEEPLARLLNALAEGAPVDGIPGVCFRRGGEIVAAPPHCPAGEPPNPYGKAYLAALNGRLAYLETSRGCPFSCAFCLSGREGKVRYFGLDRAKRDILLLGASGTRTVKFVDRTFNADRARAREIFGFIIGNYGAAIPPGVCFHFEIAGDLLDGETLTLLETAPKGAIQFEIGLQSFNGKTLAAINRKTDTARLKENIGRLVSFGSIHVHIDLIAGLPREAMRSFAGSFDAAYALRPHMLQLGFLKLLHGADMRARPDAYPCRYDPAPPYEVLETPWLTAPELKRLHGAEDALERLYNSGRFRRTLCYVLERTGMTPFALFMSAGDFLAEREVCRLPLDDFTALALEFFGALEGVERAALRDALVCDRLATNSTGRLPRVLQSQSGRIKPVMTAVNAANPLKKGVKRGFALLQGENAAVYADYTDKDPVTGEYALHKVLLPGKGTAGD
ncbi:Radical SAM superfamily enzyme YgiQ, UPF0313 family [Sporobacter termitidis DSM 10068]|uniref:Radical SAM superfamily enzyme YgiQ, UPF0313 family n=1 Tax=Sporobacter termitidis DSM 10068 TaxID=1123282 RepID=A0A1M5YDQ2_9FIRM|nr:B12-binding domain-containing radical SAM protein [Sporobacter termitidis]SHI10082.1 Radical SAM superfamily enzyme YgiQ, UPF0313 family [Sporobacter termitidis DSM 10068]